MKEKRGGRRKRVYRQTWMVVLTGSNYGMFLNKIYLVTHLSQVLTRSGQVLLCQRSALW